MDELTERKQRILRAVVLEYVESAEPVGSSLLVERYEFGVGRATVRHELSEMADRGYLDQPHTSAGRIPSDVGYRYFVNRLAEPVIDRRNQRQVAALSTNDAGPEDLLLQTCRVLSRLTEYVSIAATFSDQATQITSVEFAGITKERILMTVLFSNGMIENKVLAGRSDLTLGDLHRLSIEFSKAVSGVPVRNISRKGVPSFEPTGGPISEVATAAWKALKVVVRATTSGRVVSEGTHFLFDQPEFRQDFDTLAKIVGALEDDEVVQEALDASDASNPVTIGTENASEALHSLAIVAGRFYIGDAEAGAIAVVGPKRMRYASAVPLVATAAKALTEALTRLMR
ncbi:MAG: heat-inducible transcriptional repressor HrcA [Armatimonadota bacterium]|nr:heat-inducible transcriptional repressor HrcA [Armatimonadota bacterium]